MRNRITFINFVLCVAVSPSMFACGGLIDGVKKASTAHEELAKTPTKLAANVKPSAADLRNEAKHQGWAALFGGAKSQEESPAHPAKDAE